jgi:hypothetical protein
MDSTTFLLEDVEVAGTNPLTDDAIKATKTAAENFIVCIDIDFNITIVVPSSTAPLTDCT